MNKRALLAVVIAVIAMIAVSQLLVEFHDWNRQQTCATAGGRNCTPTIPLNRE